MAILLTDRKHLEYRAQDHRNATANKRINHEQNGQPVTKAAVNRERVAM
jgi:hypothetical protein